MANKDMYALGSQGSAIRELFAYGQAQAAKVGKENVFDFSIGNPSRPLRASGNRSNISWLHGNLPLSTAIRRLPGIWPSAKAWQTT